MMERCLLLSPMAPLGFVKERGNICLIRRLKKAMHAIKHGIKPREIVAFYSQSEAPIGACVELACGLQGYTSSKVRSIY